MDKAWRQGPAEWIWIRPPKHEQAGLIPRGEADLLVDRNRFVYFRKEFTLTEVPGTVHVRASAGGRYILFVNGVCIGRGPARCHPGWHYIDPYEIAAALQPGRNVIAALVHSYGQDTSWYETPKGAQAILFGCGGFYLEAKIKAPDGVLAADTDGSWKFNQADAWESDTPFGGTGFVERFDATKEPPGWNLPGFDDSVWQHAHIQRIAFPAAGSDFVPFPRLVERDIAALRSIETKPTRVKRNPDVEWKHAGGQWQDCCEDLMFQPGGNDTMVIDIGRILLGRLRLAVDAGIGSRLEFFSGECLGADGLVFQPSAIPGIFTPLVHRVCFREGEQQFTQFEAAGFRYLQFQVLACTRPLIIHSILIEESAYPSDTPGAFSCSDGNLTELWKAGAYTASVCRQDGMIDCPSREQRQWTGDTYIQSLLNYVTDGDTRLVRKMLLQSAQTQRPDGMIMMASACDLEVDARTCIPDYALSWILAAERYVLHTGDYSILTEVFPSIAKAIAWFLPYLDANGLLSEVPGWVFIDWSDRLDKRGAVLALNALFAGALDAAARIAGLVEAPRYARTWKALAATLRAIAAEAFWDESRGLYADARTTGGLSITASQQGNAAAIAFGIAPRERWDRIFDTILDEKKLKLTRTWRWDKERPFNAEKDIVLAQPYFSHFLHRALAMAGRVGDIIANIKLRWTPMLEEGNTFHESWQVTEMTSRCHAFSATPTWDLSTYVLGVSALADGYSRFKVCPHFAGLDWASGTVPTPAGMIQVDWQRNHGNLEITIVVPVGLSGILQVVMTGEPARVFELTTGNNTFSIP
jgi:hypothetical protein